MGGTLRTLPRPRHRAPGGEIVHLLPDYTLLIMAYFAGIGMAWTVHKIYLRIKSKLTPSQWNF